MSRHAGKAGMTFIGAASGAWGDVTPDDFPLT